MISVKGTIKNGVVLPLEPVKKTDEGRTVMITFVDDERNASTDLPPTAKTKTFEELIEECQIDTGIIDLASNTTIIFTEHQRNN